MHEHLLKVDNSLSSYSKGKIFFVRRDDGERRTGFDGTGKSQQCMHMQL